MCVIPNPIGMVAVDLAPKVTSSYGKMIRVGEDCVILSLLHAWGAWISIAEMYLCLCLCVPVPDTRCAQYNLPMQKQVSLESLLGNTRFCQQRKRNLVFLTLKLTPIKNAQLISYIFRPNGCVHLLFKYLTSSMSMSSGFFRFLTDLEVLSSGTTTT